MNEKHEVLVKAMYEYSNAIRGDWSDFDGRTERDIIQNFADAINSESTKTIDDWRADLGICQVGFGHWCGPWGGHCSAGTEEWDCNCPCTSGVQR